MPSIRRRPGRQTWTVRLSAGRDPVTGRRRQVEVSTGKRSRREAERVAAEIAARAAQGELPSTDRTTVAEWLERWLEEVAAPNLAPKTVTSYRAEVRLHIAPVLGTMPLRALQPADLSRLYALKRETLAPSHVRYLHRILHRALAVAVRWGLVPRNVADHVDAPRVPQHERPVLDADQAARVLEQLRGDRLYALYWLALEVGLRAGELCALRWSGVDWEGRTLAVTSQLQRLKGRGLVERPTKARRPRSRVPLSQAAVEVLRDHRARQDREREQAGSAWQGADYVFAWEDGRPLDPNWVSRQWRRHREQLGLQDVRLHDLRHTSAALGAAYGEPLESIADRLGHRSRTTTLGLYGHLLPPAARREAERRADLLRGSRRSDPPAEVRGR